LDGSAAVVSRETRRGLCREATVKTHVGRVLDKLGVRDRVQAVIYACESGLVEPGGLRKA
jgi:hypothetical protein